MLINASNLSLVFQGFNTAFNKGAAAARPSHPRVAMTVTSSLSEEKYGWLADIPRIREWLGDRVVRNLSAHGYAVVNKKYENTIGVQLEFIEDDKYGIFTPLLEEMGKQTTEHPDELVFVLLAGGFATACYDGRPFFDTEHPMRQTDGSVASVSNMQSGDGPAWFLLDTSRPIKPLIWQPRTKYIQQHLMAESDENVFWRDEYIYGVRARQRGLRPVAARLCLQGRPVARELRGGAQGHDGAEGRRRPAAQHQAGCAGGAAVPRRRRAAPAQQRHPHRARGQRLQRHHAGRHPERVEGHGRADCQRMADRLTAAPRPCDRLPLPQVVLHEAQPIPFGLGIRQYIPFAIAK